MKDETRPDCHRSGRGSFSSFIPHPSSLLTMRILITGITGFIGSHLVEHLVAAGGHALFGMSREGQWPQLLAYLTPHATLHAADLCDLANNERILRETRPDWAIHLAGYANTGGSCR